MTRWFAVVLALCGCDQLFALTHVDDPTVDAAITSDTGMPDMAGCATPYVGSTTYSIVATPYSITLADVDGVNGPDIIAPSFGGNTVGILFNDGQGGFTTRQEHMIGQSPTRVLAIDATDDGLLDLVATAPGANAVTVVKGHGNGTFDPYMTYSTGSNTGPRSLARGDFDGNGTDELIVTLNATSQVAVMQLPGLSFVNSYTVAGAPDDIAVARFDGNQTLDFVVSSMSLNQLAIYHGNGNGSFTPGPTATTGSNPQDLEVADFNGDAKPDVVVVEPAAQQIQIFLNDGTGTLSSVKSIPASSSVWGVSADDLDGDGDIDITFGQYSQGLTFFTLINDGTGEFTSSPHLTSAKIEDVAIGELDGKPPKDLVVANYDVGTVSVYLGCAP